MNLEAVKSLDELKSYVLGIERNLFQSNIEGFLKQGWALTQIKAQVKDFYEWVDDNLELSITTVQRRILLYETAVEKKLIESSLVDLNNNLIEQLTVIWREIEGKSIPVLGSYKRITDQISDSDTRKLSRFHPDKPPFYSKSDKVEEKIKRMRESWVIVDGLEKVKELLKGWESQFKVWKESIEKYDEENLRTQEKRIEKLIEEIKR